MIDRGGPVIATVRRLKLEQINEADDTLLFAWTIEIRGRLWSVRYYVGPQRRKDKSATQLRSRRTD
ncbi:hypothetical protein RBSWK_01577 [Rhodopirellula baltica SWK14]|uniref:Uncharacterized protein n=1 Tax=Rhodopirellula baltica SWK14 TaxID=993516 RepID=L7CN85_RHOBT|nr:hypothetical protein RBSWK_01577 [Rhodopirellula baltica SWK14]